MVKSPRLALERLQCNNSATLFAQRARGKSGRLEVWRAPGEKGASARNVGCGVGVVWGAWCWGVKHDGVEPWCAEGVVPFPIAVAALRGRDRVGWGCAWLDLCLIDLLRRRN